MGNTSHLINWPISQRLPLGHYETRTGHVWLWQRFLYDDIYTFTLRRYNDRNTPATLTVTTWTSGGGGGEMECVTLHHFIEE